MVAATQQTTDQQRLVCPRCESGLAATYDELECLICGYVDYSWTPSTAQPQRIKRDGDVRFRLPYVGDFHSMQGNFILVRLDRTTTKQPLEVSCPFCGDRMDQTSLTCSGKGAREERYICRDNHRVSMMRDRDGGMGWR
jgi:ribosomal protein S27AE